MFPRVLHLSDVLFLLCFFQLENLSSALNEDETCTRFPFTQTMGFLEFHVKLKMHEMAHVEWYDVVGWPPTDEHVRPFCDVLHEVLQQSVDFCYEAWRSKTYVMAAAVHCSPSPTCDMLERRSFLDLGQVVFDAFTPHRDTKKCARVLQRKMLIVKSYVMMMMMMNSQNHYGHLRAGNNVVFW